MSVIRASVWNGDAGCEFEVEDDTYNPLAADDVQKRTVQMYREAFEAEPAEVSVEEITEE